MSLEAVGAENTVPDGERGDPEGPTITPEVCVQHRPRHMTEGAQRQSTHTTPHAIHAALHAHAYTTPPTRAHRLTYPDSSTFSGDSSDWKP